jgi:hypothetical protein
MLILFVTKALISALLFIQCENLKMFGRPVLRERQNKAYMRKKRMNLKFYLMF